MLKLNLHAIVGLLCTGFMLAGCSFAGVVPDSLDITPPVVAATPSPTLWTDELTLMNGICFESAYDARDRVFVLRNEAELTHFYDLADNSHLCRHPVERGTFDFSTGQILAGLWSYGYGCTAHHTIIETMRDDTTKQLTIRLKFLTEGDCNYELVRPFWVGLSGVSDYAIEITVE